MVKFRVRVRHKGRVRLDPPPWKDQERATIFQMSNGFPHHLHPSGCVIRIWSKNSMLTYMGKMFKEGNITDNDFVIGAVDMRGDDNRINRSRMVRGNDQGTCGGNIFHATGGMGFNKARQEPARPGWKPAFCNRAIETDANLCSGVRGFAEDQADEFVCKLRIWQSKGLDQFINQRFREGMDFVGLV